MRWLQNLVHQITWLHITRFFGIAALVYEVLVQQVDRPSLMIVIGAMILGTEALSLGRGGRRSRNDDDDSE